MSDNTIENIAKQKIALAASVLICFGIGIFMFELLKTFVFFVASQKLVFHLPFLSVIVLLIGFILKKKGYKATRRITFLASAMIGLLVIQFINEAQYLYYMQMPMQLMRLQYITLDGIISLVEYFVLCAVVIYVYRLLSDDSIQQAAKNANVPYEPFWRYSPRRGFLITFVLAIFSIIGSHFISIAVDQRFALLEPGLKNYVKLYIGPNYKYWVSGSSFNESFTNGIPLHVDAEIIYYTPNKIEGMRYFGSVIVSKESEVFKETMSAAKSGNKDGQYELALAYYYALGKDVDPGQGFYWAKRSAEQGNKKAQNLVAHAYKAGVGVPMDNQKALEWSKKAR